MQCFLLILYVMTCFKLFYFFFKFTFYEIYCITIQYNDNIVHLVSLAVSVVLPILAVPVLLPSSESE